MHYINCTAGLIFTTFFLDFSSFITYMIRIIKIENRKSIITHAILKTIHFYNLSI